MIFGAVLPLHLTPKYSMEHLLPTASLTPTNTTEKSSPLPRIVHSHPLQRWQPSWQVISSHKHRAGGAEPADSCPGTARIQGTEPCNVPRVVRHLPWGLLLVLLPPPRPSLPSRTSSELRSRCHLSRFPGAKLPERPVPLLTGADRVPGVEPKPGVGRTAVLAASASLEGFQL